jgi:hypothetical protein
LNFYLYKEIFLADSSDDAYKALVSRGWSGLGSCKDYKKYLSEQGKTPEDIIRFSRQI